MKKLKGPYFLYCLLILPQLVSLGYTQSTPETQKEVIVTGTNSNVTNNASNEFNTIQIIEPSRSVLKKDAYYEQQQTSWKEMVKQQPKSANAWINYYKTTRFSYYTATSKELNSEQQDELDGIIKKMELNVPATYEYHYAKYINGNNDTKLFMHLEQAYKLNPKSTEIYDEMIGYYEITGNDEKKKEFCKKLNESGVVSTHVKSYAANLLNSVEENSVLITHGEMDTYPLFISQEINAQRKDVKVINFDLLKSDEYIKAVNKEFGIGISNAVSKDKLVEDLATQLSTKKPVYISNTFSPSTLKLLKANLYLTGLAMKYSSTAFENTDMLVKNWETKIKSDYLTSATFSEEMVKKMNGNYIPALVMLYEKYNKAGDKDKADKVKAIALKLGRDVSKEHQVKTAMGIK